MSAATGGARTAIDCDAVGDHYLPERAARALAEFQTVFALGGGVFAVVAEGPTYRVDLEGGRCTCADHKHRGETCKHLWRVAFAVGLVDVPARIDPAGDLRVHNGEGLFDV